MASRERSGHSNSRSSNRYRNSKEFVVERSQPTRGIITGVAVGRDRERNFARDSGRNSPRVPRNPESGDSKISTQTRIIARADSEELFSAACHQIESLLEASENRKYVIKNFSFLHQNLLDGYKGIVGVDWKASGIKVSAKLLGVIVNSMENHSSMVCNWLTDSIFAACESSKHALAAVIRDVVLGALTHMKPPQISILMKCIHDQIEDISDPSVFKLFTTIFAEGLLKNQGNTETEVFSDFSDVIIGWMTDGYESELGDTYFHLYDIIQKLEPYFAKEIVFLGDLISSVVDFVKEAEDETPLNCVRIIRLLKTLESLLSLKTHLNKKFLKATMEQLVETINKILSQFVANELKQDRQFREFVHFTNENLSRVPGADGPAIQSFMKNQMEWYLSGGLNISSWTSELLVGYLTTLKPWVDTVGAQSQLTEDIQSFCRKILPFLDTVQPFLPGGDNFHILQVTHALFRTRNLALLQTLYQWILDKLKRESPNQSNNYKRVIKSDYNTQLFVVASLADIATNKSGSILSLWALDPSILELLILISAETTFEPVRLSALEMLKSYCIAHSHFASNITSSKIFDMDTPALRFLVTLLEFWKSCLEDMNFPKALWLFDWISLFFKSTVPYAAVLLERHLEIYCDILRLMSNWEKLFEKYLSLLQWMFQDENYSQLVALQEVVREICLRILLSDVKPKSTRDKFGDILKILPNLIFLPDELPKLQGKWNYTEVQSNAEEGIPMSHPELNAFLQKLLGYHSGEHAHSKDVAPSKQTIALAVDYIIRSKLKTILGRAPEFFSQLSLMVRKILLKGVRKTYAWKLDFVYQIQRKIHLCIHESAFLTCDIPESIRSFYVTNKIPCTGWLKKLAPECIEFSFGLKRYAMAYFFAVSVSDTQKAKLALLELQDTEGLKGIGELGGYFFLNSEYEKAEEMANMTLAIGPDPISELLLEKTKLIFEGSASKLQTWGTPVLPPAPIHDLGQIIVPTKIPLEPPRPPWNPKLLRLPVEANRTLLSLQLAQLGSLPQTEVVGNVESFSKLKLFEMIQVEDFILSSKKFSIEEKTRMQNCKLQKMIECGNLKWLRNWITSSGWLDMAKLEFNLEQKVNTFRILGDLLYKERDFHEAGTLYSCILEIIIEKDGKEIRGQTSPLIPNDFKANFYLAFMEKVRNSETFYERAVIKSRILSALEGKIQLQQEFFDRAREFSRTSTTQVRADVWFQYATFAYERSEDDELTPVLKEVMQSNALHSYANYIKWIQKRPKDHNQRGTIMRAMIRLVTLFHKNHKFIPEDLVTSSLWLTILPELVKIPELRPYLLTKFPSESKFLAASHEYVKFKKRFARRRGLFDPITYAYTEVSEELFEPGTEQPNLSREDARIEGKTVETLLNEHWGKEIPPPGPEILFQQDGVRCQQKTVDLGQQLSPYLTIVKEMERIGTTKEELWAETIQRVIHDWGKRMNALRKDVARDRGDQWGNAEKIKVYFRPVATFLKEMWRRTLESNTPADLAFICKYCDRVEAIVTDVESCKSLDKLNQIYDKLLQYAAVFESAKSSKLSLDNVSPVLAEWRFGDLDQEIILPGMENGVTVASVINVITCLHTKTNPKRIGFRGTNGRVYEYLIKGNENLHIDAGIMQMLKITEEFSGCPTRHYSVVPIAERGGLIQIVPNAVPLFVMYKKFLQRNNATERPSDVFWRRLESLGYKDREDLEGLKEVYHSLKEETPPDLISRDLLMCAENTMDWYKAVKTYTRDCAMGAAVGYSLALADRHLDNILINLREGHLVHVDFSILFGKGALLKVPERVPFRLTQNIVEALQYPGINGPFAVYLDKFLANFKMEQEMTLFCIRNIARDAQLDEGVYISPEVILRTEIVSCLDLIRLRVKNVWRMMEIVMGEILECTNEVKDTSSVWNLASPRITTERLGKKLYRWRRLLANLDPLITFIVMHSKASGALEGFHHLVFNTWIPQVIKFWTRTDIAVTIQSQGIFPEKFQICEDVLQGMLGEISKFSSADFEICTGPIVNSGKQRIDKDKLEGILNSAQNRISSYLPFETANALIAEATNVDNLAQMYEGWIPWV